MHKKNRKYRIMALALASTVVLSGWNLSNVKADDLDDLRSQLEDYESTREELERARENLASSLDDDEEKTEEVDRVIQDIEEKLRNHNDSADKLNRDLDAIVSQKNDVQYKINEINSKIQETLNKIYLLKEDIIIIENNIKDTKNKIEKLKLEIAKNTELLKERLVAMYKLGDVAKIEILFQANDINDFLSRNVMMTNITKHDKDLISKLKKDKNELDDLVKKLNGQMVSLEISKKNEEEKSLELSKQKETQAELLKSLEVKENNKNNELEKAVSSIRDYESFLEESLNSKLELAKKKRSLEAEIEELESKINEALENESDVKSKIQEKKDELERKKEQLDNVNKIEEDQNKRDEEESSRNESTMLEWPTSATYISSYFGERLDPIDGTPSYHWGLDIAGPEGTDIYAAESGTVTHVGWYGGYGNLIIIQHGNGLETRYAHLSGYYVSEGDSVSRGQLIAPMGTTGYSTGPHLHFEVRINGEAQDPLDYIR